MKKSLLNSRNVREIFNYSNGALYWRERSLKYCSSERSMNSFNSRMKGRKVGNVNTNGYVQFELNIGGVRERFLAHRVIWLYVYGFWPSKHIDHIDHNPTNNSIDNLRDVTVSENARNRSYNCRNTSGVQNVYWNKAKKKWEARIRTDKGKIFLGLFDDKNEAIPVIELAKKEHGYHKNHGVKL